MRQRLWGMEIKTSYLHYWKSQCLWMWPIYLEMWNSEKLNPVLTRSYLLLHQQQYTCGLLCRNMIFFSKAQNTTKNIQQHMLSVDKMAPKLSENERCLVSHTQFFFQIIIWKKLRRWIEGKVFQKWSPSTERKNLLPPQFNDNSKIYMPSFIFQSEM